MSTVKRQMNRLSKSARKWKISWVTACTVVLFLVAPPHSADAGSGFNLAVSPTSVAIQPGGDDAFTITVQCKTCNVSIGASISPSVRDGPTLTLSRYHFFTGGVAKLGVAAGQSTPLMTYTITVIAKDLQSLVTETVSVTLTVNDFAITANPTKITVSQGQTATSTVTVTGINGFSGAIYNSVNEPSAATTGLACSLPLPYPVTLSSTVTSVSSTLSCSGTPGTYNVIISAFPYNGLPVRSATVTITVK